MTATDHTGSRPRFAALLRAGLPSSLTDAVPFIVVLFTLRFIAQVSWAASAGGAIVFVPLAMALAAAGAWAVSRIPRRTVTQDPVPDLEADGDGS